MLTGTPSRPEVRSKIKQQQDPPFSFEFAVPPLSPPVDGDRELAKQKWSLQFQPQHQRVKVKVTQLFPTCDPIDCTMEFSRSEYWNREPFPSPGDLPNPEIEPRSPALQVDSLPTELSGKPHWG